MTTTSAEDIIARAQAMPATGGMRIGMSLEGDACAKLMTEYWAMSPETRMSCAIFHYLASALNLDGRYHVDHVHVGRNGAGDYVVLDLVKAEAVEVLAQMVGEEDVRG